jgi:DNA-binding transcriptional LysR family regulator
MEFRVLRYFLAVCQEGSISNAAEVLHLTQPTLSRQLKHLEEECGKELFLRGNRKITLTPEGVFLRQRARELLALESETAYHLSHGVARPSKQLCIGFPEQADLQCIMPAVLDISRTNPAIPVRLTSGGTRFLLDQLDSGLLDFAMVFEPFDHSRYSFMTLPQKATWNVVMQKDDALAGSHAIVPDALAGKTVYCSTDAASSPWVAAWLGNKERSVHKGGTFSLRETGVLLARERLGYVILQGTVRDPACCVRPCAPQDPSSLCLLWRHHPLELHVRVFLQHLSESLHTLPDDLLDYDNPDALDG